tara:strand:- start:183 stop:2948 length:2766 start_codon:yes stop_codon:yes gene_type:complete
MKSFTRVSTAVIIGLTLTACGQKSSDEHFEAAQTFLANDQFNSALVELKSALQKDPERADYRLALAQLYVKVGALDDAVKEYQRADQYSADNSAFVQEYVKVLYLNGNYSDILTLLEDTSAYAQPEQDYLLTFKALAEAELGGTENAEALFNQLSASSQTDVADYAAAFQALAKSDLADVKQKLMQIPESSALYHQSLYVRSKIALAENDTTTAINLLKAYVAQNPYHLLPQLLLAQSYVKTEQLQLANAILQPLLKKVPQQPLANYFAAIIAYDKKDFEQARINIDTAIGGGFNSAQARILAALIAVNLKLENVALSHLEVIKDILKHYPEAEMLYAQLMLKAGNTEVAQQLLSGKELQQSDIQLLAATAFELTKQGSTEAAQNLLAQYKSDEPFSARELLTLGAIQLKMPGQRDTAIRSLEQALQLDPAADQARVLLLTAYIRQQEYDKAMALADEWIASAERSNAGHNMKAYVALVSEQPDIAAEHIELVLTKEPKNSLARLLNASLAAAKGDTTLAKQRFQALLDDEPQNIQALEQYIALSHGTGDKTDALQRLTKAQKAAPQDYNLTLMLASFKHNDGAYNEALELLNSIKTEQREWLPMHWAYLIDTQLRLNAPAQALQSAQSWHTLQPASNMATQAYMQALYANKDYIGALKLVEQLLAAQPGHTRFINIKLQILDEAERSQQLLEFVHTLPDDIQQKPETQFFVGKALTKEQKYSDAVQTLSKSYAKQANVKTALLLAELHSRIGSTDKGIALLEKHIAAQGSTPTIQAMLAQLSLNTDADRAVQTYQTMLKEQPDNVLALNNLAWLMLEKGNLSVALAHAKKAHDLQPKHPDILDTYGKVLLATGDATKAKEMFEASLNVRPDTSQVQLHYAEALVKTGSKEKARSVLEQLADNQEVAAQAKALMAELGLED